MSNLQELTFILGHKTETASVRHTAKAMTKPEVAQALRKAIEHLEGKGYSYNNACAIATKKLEDIVIEFWLTAEKLTNPHIVSTLADRLTSRVEFIAPR
jgi:hypothetical protein